MLSHDMMESAGQTIMTEIAGRSESRTIMTEIAGRSEIAEGLDRKVGIAAYIGLVSRFSYRP